jgi:small GTP-binding protein
MSSIQCAIIGDSGVGKTALIRSAAHQPMSTLPTLGVDMISYISDNVHMQCWDTSGQQRFRHIVEMFVKNCAVVIYVFDATSEKSFESIVQWHQQQHSDKKYFAVCNKVDLPQAQPEKYKEILRRDCPDITFIAASALQNAESVMHEIATSLANQQDQAQTERECCIVV